MALNFDKTVANLIAKPATKDGIPLFTRVDGMVDHNGGTERVPENSEYASKSKSVCTSPDNLKRIFITCKGVYVHLHKPVLGSGKGFDLKREYSYSDELNKAINLKTEAFKRGARIASQQSKVFRGTEVYGFGLRALRAPFVYQNIEEVYFDWLPLSNYSSDKGADFSTYLSKAGGNVDIALALLFKAECGVGVTNIMDRYPRLHTIGYIPMLEGLYKQCDKGKNSNTFNTWLSYAVGGSLANIDKNIVKIRNDNSWIMNWSVKDGIYTFDRDIIKPYAEEVKAKFSEIQKREMLEREEASKCEKERTLDTILKQGGMYVLRTTMKAMINNNEISRDIVERDFSESGKKKYGDILTNLGR